MSVSGIVKSLINNKVFSKYWQNWDKFNGQLFGIHIPGK